MEIFISGSQVCEKKNIFGLGPFQVFVCKSQALLGREKSVPVPSGRRAFWQQEKLFPAKSEAASLPLQVVRGCVLCLGQSVLGEPDATARGHPWDPSPTPWDPLQFPGRQEQIGEKLDILFLSAPICPFNSVFFLRVRNLPSLPFNIFYALGLD